MAALIPPPGMTRACLPKLSGSGRDDRLCRRREDIERMRRVFDSDHVEWCLARFGPVNEVLLGRDKAFHLVTYDRQHDGWAASRL